MFYRVLVPSFNAGSWGSSDGVVTRMDHWKHDFLHVRVMRFFFSHKHPGWLWIPSIFTLSGYWV